MVQHQPGTCDALGSIPGTNKEKEWKLMLDPKPLILLILSKSKTSMNSWT